MSAPTLDRPPAATQSTSSGRRRRPVLLLAAAALVLATAVGTSLAIATRPDQGAEPAPAAVAAEAPVTDQAEQAAQAAPGQRSDQTPAAEQPSAPSPTPGQPKGDQPPVLADGTHQARITKVDSANDRIVVDVVQVFHDDAAVKAAIADGKPKDQAQYLHTWVRNQNPRLRTLPLAANLQVRLHDTCGDEGPSREAQLTKLAANARTGAFYYDLTVSGGSVQRIQERLAINAC